MPMNPIHFSPPALNQEDIQAVVEVLYSGWITSGSVGVEFETLLCSYTKASSVVLLNSATAALFLSLKSFGIGEGDEVITTPYTFAATANAIYHTGAKIVFADVQPHTFFISPQKVVEKLSAKTKAVIPVDFGGALADYQDLQQLLNNHPISATNSFQEALARPLLLSDSAHSLGVKNTLADIRAYSFHAVKNLTTAEGGAAGVHYMGGLEDEFTRNLRLLALHGQDRSARDKFLAGSWEYDIKLPGYKNNMPDILAALGLSQLKRYETDILPKRREIFDMYQEVFSTDEYLLPHFSKGHSAHLFPLRVRDFSKEKRNQLIQLMANENIYTNVHYKPLTLMSVNQYYQSEACIEAEKLWLNEVSLPIHMGMSKDDVFRVVDCLKKSCTVLRDMV